MSNICSVTIGSIKFMSCCFLFSLKENKTWYKIVTTLDPIYNINKQNIVKLLLNLGRECNLIILKSTPNLYLFVT